jgi:hypothetical protein
VACAPESKPLPVRRGRSATGTPWLPNSRWIGSPIWALNWLSTRYHSNAKSANQSMIECHPDITIYYSPMPKHFYFSKGVWGNRGLNVEFL